MRKTLIATLAVLACALGLCALSMAAVNRTVEAAERLQSLAALAESQGDADGAKSLMLELAERWREGERLMETLASHDALHEVAAAIAEAQICLECEDHDDFLRTMSGLRMGLDHLRDEQAVRLSNLY